MKPITAFTWMISLMVAPHTLAHLGNLAGTLQTSFPIWMVAAAAIYWINASSLADFSDRKSKPNPAAMEMTIEGLSLSSRWMTTIMLSTVLLVTAGFTFNETFLYWFPNFAFAFVLLGALILVHLLGNKAIRRVQMVLVTVVLAGLMVLLALGLWQLLGNSPKMAAGQIPFQASALPGMVLLFVGFDLALDHARNNHSPQVRRTIIWGIAAMTAMMGAWGWISLQLVSAEKLSNAFIPHIMTARAVGGDAGRMIMGAMIISGSAAAVSALLSAISRSNWKHGAHQLKQKPSWPDRFNRPATWIFVASITIGLMMAGGMAGTEIIDSYVRAGLILWLLFYGTIHASQLVERLKGRMGNPNAWNEWIRPLIGATSMFGCSVVLVMVNPDKAAMLKISTAGLLLATLVVWAKRRWSSANVDERNKKVIRPYRLNE